MTLNYHCNQDWMGRVPNENFGPGPMGLTENGSRPIRSQVFEGILKILSEFDTLRILVATVQAHLSCLSLKKQCPIYRF